jgi:hypothetical protein
MSEHSDSQPSNLRRYLIIWIGQVASLLGSNMTGFALTIWVWQQTQQATPITLIAFFSEVPILAVTLFAGVWVDRASRDGVVRWNRKHIMMLGDAIAAFSTVAVLVLFLTNHLVIWHLYLTGAIAGIFGYLQGLAFSASQALLVSKQQYVRIGALGSIKTFGTGVLAPALAGVLYPFIGLTGILILDLITFCIAITTLFLVQIPQPIREGVGSGKWGMGGVGIQAIWQELTIGFRYLWNRPSLLALQLFSMSFIFFDTASAVAEPMILARSGNNTTILGSVSGAVGLGGLIGGIVLSFWGGPKRRIHGLLIGRGLVFGFESLLGLVRSPSVWISANFCAGLFKPLANSCEDAIWLSKVDPHVQGRVFSASSFLTSITSPLGLLIAGPLADRVFEPAMQPGGKLAPFLGEILGTGTGSGMALQFALFSLIRWEYFLWVSVRLVQPWLKPIEMP